MTRAGRVDRLDCGEQRLGKHHHPGSAPERRVVEAAMAVGRVLAQVVHRHVDQVALARPSEQ
jgi:hypothetical protein